MHKHLFESLLAILLGIYLGVQLLGHMVTLFSWAAFFISSRKEVCHVLGVPVHSWSPWEKIALLSLSVFLGS